MGDDFGDRMKGYERQETSGQFDRTLPLYVRIDGRGFSKFTRDMKRPYDERMSNAMIRTTAMLIERTNARVGYVQSDEISLLLVNDAKSAVESQFMFDGKKQKIVSVFAALATACFTRAVLETPGFEHYAERMPHFDARAFSLPSIMEATNAFLWREQDATKNAISMAAHAVFSHKFLQGKSGREKVQMLTEAGVDFHAHPAFFTRGTFLRRVLEQRTLTENERNAIPEANRPDEGQTFTRSKIVAIDMPSFTTVTNREDVLFNGAEPLVA